ncbi:MULTISPECIES: ubiquinol oxidase subunit II [Acinetobacter]|jgi:cytochrome o ubiquinol oxidase subunit II|uniref:Ubiquinol oxidase subunit 2 n=1 Tax=Acinetobacter pollinis TaxID=2605270 RepID=A0ABU6DQX7_9GAMM|nr:MULTISPECIES: ubiquinol oxidase subunit II [Acinetobacter]MBF7690768.1 ubiquinol oxidase subunit II [Acinetobacter pollinis]MBF7693681.1 ubiquinol oxidase subunit II [Acinetobacter pollinis]MBF7698372.1 ubiquinol oxidase subunit II [Acinetobacter pollinis]MBF7701291.1 ubiquinol oxidase subunit II [Acinetobacter pollinis]MEB5476244.1 ubiquinol oxidase subunit II [Acinetobacter pollinis]
MRQTILAVLSLSAISTLLTGCGGDLVLLNSKGPVAEGLSGLMMTAIYLMLLVVIPSIIMALWFGWKYRASNKDADYKPTWAHSTTIEIVVWGIPIIIIAILAWIAWWGSHQYDPYRPLNAESDKKTLDIQVIAEPYKWVFVYPEQQIATVNEIRFPEQTPVHFHITSDFTMNSFFIPQLAGQIYAMAGMQTHLHVLADETGIFRGFSANYSGYGFSQMHFKAHSVTQSDFDKWVSNVKAGKGTEDNSTAIQKSTLDFATLQGLRDGERSTHQIEGMLADAKTPKEKAIAEEAERMGPYPTKPHPVTYYSSVEPQLFRKVIDKYMSNYHGAEKADSSHANMQHMASAGE